MSEAPCRVESMDFDSLVSKAATLGQDHAEDDHHGIKVSRLYSGKQVASALDVGDVLSGDQYVKLREAYADGWSSWR